MTKIGTPGPHTEPRTRGPRRMDGLRGSAPYRVRHLATCTSMLVAGVGLSPIPAARWSCLNSLGFLASQKLTPHVLAGDMFEARSIKLTQD